jgi:hypothetical protein
MTWHRGLNLGILHTGIVYGFLPAFPSCFLISIINRPSHLLCAQKPGRVTAPEDGTKQRKHPSTNLADIKHDRSTVLCEHSLQTAIGETVGFGQAIRYFPVYHPAERADAG